jgi:uncharacterized protein (DUF2141 family)
VKELLLFFVLLFTGALSYAQGTVVAQISNARNDQGECQVCLYDNATSFKGDDGGTPVRCMQAPVKNGTSEVRFENVPSGIYAVMVFHDVNRNKKLDQNFLGIPKEGYGASGNKLPFASAPTFEDNKFTLPDKSTITLRIRLRNL